MKKFILLGLVLASALALCAWRGPGRLPNADIFTIEDQLFISNENDRQAEVSIYGGTSGEYPFTVYNGSTVKLRYITDSDEFFMNTALANVTGALNVTGAVSISGNTTIAGSSFSLSGNTTIANTTWVGLGAAKGRIEFDDQSTDEVNILTARVGIGTQTPGKPLSVEGDMQFNGTINIGPSNDGQLLYNTSGTYIRGSDGIHFQVYPGSWTESITITAAAVGVNTTAPAAVFTVAPPAAQTIAAETIITANACGTIRLITASGAVTTNTTDTFTNATSAGCCMDVVNSGANAITLDYNARFISNGAADVVLGANDTCRVCSSGTTWYQIGSTGNN